MADTQEPTWEESTEIEPTWDDSAPVETPQAPNVEQPLRESLFVAKDKNSDQIAESFKLAKKMGLPEDATDFVDRNYSDLKVRSEFEQNDFNKLVSQFPKTASFLSNPLNAQLAKDDQDHLTWFEKTVQSYEYSRQAQKEVTDTFGPIAGAFISGGAQAGAMLSRAPFYAADLMEVIRAKSFGEKPQLLDKSFYENKAAKYFDDITKKFIDDVPAISESAWEQIKAGDINGAGATLGLKIIQGMPISIAAGAAFASGGAAAGIVGVGIPSAAQEYYENIEAPGVAPETNIAVSGLKGLAEGAFEVIGIDAAIGSLAKGMYKAGGKAGLEALAQGLKPVLEAFGAEAGEEFGTSVTQDLLDYVSGINPDAIKGLWSRGIEAGIVGGFSGVGSPAIHIEGYKRFQQLKEAEKARDFLNSLSEEGQKSKLKARLPEKYQEAISSVLQGQESVEKVYLDTNDFKTYAQSVNKPPAEVAAQMGIIDAYNKAEQNGMPIEMTTAQWANQPVENAEHFQGLTNDVQLGNRMSVNQAKKNKEQLKADLEKEKADAEARRAAQTEARKEAAEIRKSLEDQLLITGKYSKQQVKDIGAVYEAYFTSYVGERAALSPKEFFAKRGMTIKNGSAKVDLTNGEVISEAEIDADITVLNQDQLPMAQPGKTLSPLGFYSQVEAEVSKMDFKEMPAQDLFNRIKNIPGVKATELNALGLQEWVKEQPDKVTKEDVLNFIKEKTPVVDQTVLGAGNAETGFDFSEPRFVPLSRADSYSFNDAVNSEIDYYINDDKEWVEETKAQIRAEIESRYTDEEGNIDEEGLESEIKSELEAKAQERAEEYVDSEDYHGAVYIIEERNSGYELQGNDEYSWYSSDFNEWYKGNKEEAKIKFAQKLIDEGIIEAKKSDLLTADKVEFEKPYGAKPSDQTIEKKARELFKKDKERLIKKAEEKYQSSYEDSDKSHEDLQKEKEEDALREAKSEVEDSYNDPTNPRNKVTIRVNTVLFDARLIGNNKKGYVLELRKEAGSGAKSVKEYKLEGNTVEDAQKSAVEHLLKLKLISKAKEKTGNEINNPSGGTKWSRHTVPGGDNYREILIQLPQNEGDKFTYRTHFNQANILAHVRTTDRTDSEGRKVLYLEEVQSDWNQQGREKGYYNEAEAKKIKNERKQIESELEKFPQAYVEEGNQEHANLLNRHRELTHELRSMEDGVTDNPFKQTESWSAVAMKRMLKYAQEMGYDAVAWTPGSVHVERWGTDSVSWVKKQGFHIYNETTGKFGATFSDKNSAEYNLEVLKNDYAGDKFSIKEGEYWLVGSVEQVGGNADGMNIEELARQRGQLLERRGERVTTKEELREVILSTLHRERTDRSLESLTDGLWKKMQTEESGVKAPRKEGMEFFYDNVLPKKVFPEILKKLDKEAKVTVADIETSDEPIKSWEIVLTDKMKESLKEGQTLFQKQGDESRAEIRIGTQSMDITLFEKADPSSPIHEFAHASLEWLGDIALDPKAQESVQKDYADVLNFLGVESREQIEKVHHEKFASAMEAYFLEGKSPSEKLRSVFHRLKNLFRSIYQYVVGQSASVDGVKVSPELKQVFDRMFATDAEIEKIMPTPMFADPASLGMNQETVDRYLKAQEEARIYAEDLLRSKVAKEEKKKQSQAYKELRTSTEKGWLNTANNMPVYKLLSVLQDGVNADGSDVSPELKGAKIDSKALEARYGKEILAVLPKGTHSPNGIAPETLAEAFGFRSVTQMIDQLSTVQPKKQFIEDKTAETLEQFFPDPMKTTLPDDALKALYNEKLFEMKQIELEHLASNNLGTLKKVIKKVTARPPRKEYVRLQARDIIKDMAIQDIKPSHFRNLERKSAKLSGEALANGDIAEAFEQKRREQLNAYLYEEARNAIDAFEELKDTIKQFKKKDSDLVKARDLNLINAGRNVLAHYNLYDSKVGSDLLAKIKEYDPDSFDHITQIIEGSKIPGKNAIESLTFGEFQDLQRTLDAIWDQAKQERLVEIEGQKLERAEVVLELINQINDVSGDKKEDYNKFKTKTLFGKIKDDLLALGTHLTRVENWVDFMDGGFGGPFRKFIWEPINQASIQYRLEKNKVFEKYEKEILKKYEHLFKGKKEIAVTEIDPTITLSPSELVMAILHSGNESNMDKLLRGRNWEGIDLETGLADFTRWNSFLQRGMREGFITKEHMDLAQEIWDLLESFKAGTQKAHKKIYGHYFDEITAQEIQTPWGAYRGGYIPAVADPYLDTKVEQRTTKNELEEQSYAKAFPSTGKGATMRRVQAYAAPLSLEFRILSNHIDWALRFTYLQPANKAVAKILLNPAFREIMDNFDKNIVNHALVPWLQRVATQRTSERTKLKTMDTLYGFLRRSASLQIMTFNFSNGLQQLTGVFPAMQQVGAANILMSSRRMVMSPIDMPAQINELSDFMRSWSNDNVFEIQDNIKNIVTDSDLLLKAENFQMMLKKHGQIFARTFQGFVNFVTWDAAFNKALSEKIDREQAIRYADSIVRKTQGTGLPESISSFEVGTPGEMLFKQFVSYFNMLANLNTFEAKRITRDVVGHTKYKELFYLVFMTYSIPAMVSKAISLGLGQGFDFDDDEKTQDQAIDVFFWSNIETGIAMLPYGQSITAFKNAFNDKPFDDKISLSPGIQTLENALITPGKVARKAWDGKHLNDSDYKKMAETIGFFTGTPIGPIFKRGQYINKYFEGDLHVDETAPEFIRGVLTGKERKK